MTLFEQLHESYRKAEKANVPSLAAMLPSSGLSLADQRKVENIRKLFAEMESSEDKIWKVIYNSYPAS